MEGFSEYMEIIVIFQKNVVKSVNHILHISPHNRANFGEMINLYYPNRAKGTCQVFYLSVLLSSHRSSQYTSRNTKSPIFCVSQILFRSKIY